MPLSSFLFKGDPALEACAVNNRDHITPGGKGAHVSKIQEALMFIDGLSIDSSELADQRYGPSTAAAVVAFKTKRSIINRSYETEVDDIVGIMTIAALDGEALSREDTAPVIPKSSCPRIGFTDAAKSSAGSNEGPLRAILWPTRT